MKPMPSCLGINVLSPDELDDKIIMEVAAEVVLTSDEAIRQELDELYAENPALFAEHLRKQAQARAQADEKVRKTVEMVHRLGLTPTAATKFIAASLRS